MRHITLTTATLAVLAFAGAAYADSNYGPRQKGNQCWHHRLLVSLRLSGQYQSNQQHQDYHQLEQDQYYKPAMMHLHCLGFPYISPISSGLRWRGERYIPKNVFFLREEVLIYDAPESATFPRMFSSSARRF
jgi:hypothetical protein